MFDSNGNQVPTRTNGEFRRPAVLKRTREVEPELLEWREDDGSFGAVLIYRDVTAYAGGHVERGPRQHVFLSAPTRRRLEEMIAQQINALEAR